jgi:hypothetical protein
MHTEPKIQCCCGRLHNPGDCLVYIRYAAERDSQTIQAGERYYCPECGLQGLSIDWGADPLPSAVTPSAQRSFHVGEDIDE